ncbi:MAG: ABC-F family ATP-binding cassette domain-containing protein [Parachlamydiaceae bacterium]|nr:ABC-F family ATP-binding cassette domain-containing protein [Parachlamydiaceae bacterium]
MSPLISAHNLSKSYGTQRLFKGISFSINSNDRIGLLGPNGAGKSTLLKILMGMDSSDDGHVSQKQGLRIGYACQEPEFPPIPLEELLLNQDLHGDPIELRTRAQIILSKMQFEDDVQDASLLSGGWKKRLDIARALMNQPDLLLLDEPTNHLDLEGILWLEKFLLREKIAYVAVSHDRYFLENISNKIIELNKCYPKGIFISDGGMSVYMEHKDAFLEAQAQQERGLASNVRDEIAWLRKSAPARTTKSRSRIQRAYELIGELSEVKQRNKTVKVDIDFVASERETRRLVVAKNIYKSFGDKPLFKDIDITLSPGTRLGIVGKNGTGKTTLLRILAGQVKQDKGTIKYADDLQIVYFDQHRAHLAPNISIREALSPHSDTVNYRGQEIHVNGWAKKFLFTPDRLSLPISCLSGGERARILIAKLILQPADLLFLDEPTNDLDIQTLEVIEESLMEFPGAVVLISHDRCLMDRVCTKIIGLGTDHEHHFFADYSQWEKSLSVNPVKKEAMVAAGTTAPSAGSKTNGSSSPSEQKSAAIVSKKLSYKEQKELDGMETAIFACDNEIQSLKNQLENPSNAADPQKSLEVYHLLASAETRLEKLYERWEYLEKLSS